MNKIAASILLASIPPALTYTLSATLNGKWQNAVLLLWVLLLFNFVVGATLLLGKDSKKEN